MSGGKDPGDELTVDDTRSLRLLRPLIARGMLERLVAVIASEDRNRFGRARDLKRLLGLGSVRSQIAMSGGKDPGDELTVDDTRPLRLLIARGMLGRIVGIIASEGCEGKTAVPPPAGNCTRQDV